MVNENVTCDDDTTLYHDTVTSNMCGYKHLFKKMWEVKDTDISFEDALKIQVKG